MQQLPNRITRLNNRNNRPYPVTGNMSPEDRAIAAQNLQNIWALQAQNNSTNNDNIGNLPAEQLPVQIDDRYSDYERSEYGDMQADNRKYPRGDKKTQKSCGCNKSPIHNRSVNKRSQTKSSKTKRSKTKSSKTKSSKNKRSKTKRSKNKRSSRNRK